MKKALTAIGRWIYSRRMICIYTAAVFAIFTGVYGIYNGAWRIAGYAALLSFVLGAAFCFVDFTRFTKTMRALEYAKEQFLQDYLPEPEDALQRQYNETILNVEARRADAEKKYTKAQRDAQEYYTLWVHQIKTPISAMDLLLQRFEQDRNSKTVHDMKQELLRIEKYVDMALQYQRLHSMQSDLVFAPFELRDLVKKAAKSCSLLFIGKRLSLDIEGVKGSIITDEKWLCFVLEQIFVNAVKYTPNGGVKVYTREKMLIIEDTGIGIPAEDLPRVFERGFTGAVGRKERSSTGIGLYLCREIMQRLGFSIEITSMYGKGTRVLLNIEQAALEME